MSDEKTLIVAATDNGSPVGDLVRMAIDKNLDADKLEKVIALYNQQEDRRRKEDFEFHFGEMQRELSPVVKNETAKKRDGAKAYDYVTLDALQAACNPIIFAHGFSYSWREEALAEGAKRTWLDISGYGYTKSNYFDSPKITGTDWQNAIQVAGSQSTYGRRYTFIAGFGIIVAGEDSDANTPDDPEILKMDLRNFMLCKREDGRLILSNENCDTIKRELDKPEPSVERLKYFHKKAREKGCK